MPERENVGGRGTGVVSLFAFRNKLRNISRRLPSKLFHVRRSCLAMSLWLSLGGVFVSTACGQSPIDGIRGPYQPLNQTVPPGVAGYWAAAVGRAEPGVFQPERIQLPTAGNVTFYDGVSARPIELTAPAQIGVAVGHIYRMRLSGMPEYPGAELYPSIEILDRLHPPPGQESKFPVPIEFTRLEIELALRGRLITKVVYLEQPQLAKLARSTENGGIIDVSAGRNLMFEADQAGRPMVLVRLGSRIPDPRGDNTAFFLTGAPLAIPQ